jgi:mono/diheme cytochrome c family protein
MASLDRVLFRIVNEVSEAVVGGGYESDMPAFGDVLSDADIRDVLAFIKSRLPDRAQAYQAQITAQDDE